MFFDVVFQLSLFHILINEAMDESIGSPGVFCFPEIVAIANVVGMNVFISLMCTGKTQEKLKKKAKN